MYLHLLFHHLKRIDAKAKFVLVAFILRYGVRGAVPAKSSQRAKDLGVPQRELGRWLVQLVSEGYLKEEAAAGRQAGRPNRAYSISDHLMELLLRSDERGTVHGDLVKRLFEGPEIIAIRPCEKETQKIPRVVWVGGKAVPKRSNRLSLPNRLLLAVLLVHADDFGVVDDLSSTELSYLTGIDVAGMKQRIRRLVALGYIRRHVPGLASALFSRKLKSVFVLNLNHPQLGGRNSSVLVHESDVRSGSDIKYVRGLIGDTRGFQAGVDGRPTPARIIRLFLREPLAAFSQLDINLCRWASDSLAHQAEGRDGQVIICNAICEFFRDSAVYSRVRKVVLGPPTWAELCAHDVWVEMVEYFLHLVRQLADECKERFAMVGEISLEYRDLMLMPSHLSLGNRCMALLVRRGAAQLGKGSVVISEAADAVRWQSYKCESDINSMLLYESGLLEKAACEPVTAAQSTG